MRKPSLLLLLALGACVHAQPVVPPRPTQVIQGEAIEVSGPDKLDLLLASMNDEELFTKGTSGYAAQDYVLAAKAFDRLVFTFPKSVHFAAASYNAGLAHEALAAKVEGEAAAVEWQAALDRYRPLLDIEHGTSDQVDAGFRAAECLYHLEKYADAIALLKRIQERPDLSKNVQLEAEVQIGICQSESGDLGAAETTLRDAVHRFESADIAERLDDYYPAQAQFFLGEIYRTYFEQVVLDPNKTDCAAHESALDAAAKPARAAKAAKPAEPDATACLAQDLEYKAEMLLSAQGHFLRAIRIGNAQWATAAGQRIGALYEAMYDAMMNAPAPRDLDQEQTDLYRLELRKKVRVLVTKAITIYERTLEAAERTGTDSPFIAQTRQSLERMKSVLLADAKADGEDPNAAAATPDPDPDHDAKPRPQPARKPSSARSSAAASPLARR